MKIRKRLRQVGLLALVIVLFIWAGHSRLLNHLGTHGPDVQDPIDAELPVLGTGGDLAAASSDSSITSTADRQLVQTLRETRQHILRGELTSAQHTLEPLADQAIGAAIQLALVEDRQGDEASAERRLRKLAPRSPEARRLLEFLHRSSTL